MLIHYYIQVSSFLQKRMVTASTVINEGIFPKNKKQYSPLLYCYQQCIERGSRDNNNIPKDRDMERRFLETKSNVEVPLQPLSRMTFESSAAPLETVEFTTCLVLLLTFLLHSSKGITI